MEAEREKLYAEKEQLTDAIDRLLEQSKPDKMRIDSLRHERKKIMVLLNQFDAQPDPEPPSPYIMIEDPLALFARQMEELVLLSKAKDRLRDLFFGRPRKVRIALALHQSGVEAKKLLKGKLSPALRIFFEEWTDEIEKRKNPDLYTDKIEVFAKKFAALRADA